MKKIIYLSFLILMLTAIATTAAEVNVTIMQDNMVNSYVMEVMESILPHSVVVGIMIMPQLELVGKLGYSLYRYDDNDGDSSSDSVFYPGLGARYTFWDNNKLGVYGVGTYSWVIRSEDDQDGDKEYVLNFGFGAAYKVDENFAVVVETGLQRFGYRNSIQEGSFSTTYTNLGVRLYF